MNMFKKAYVLTRAYPPSIGGVEKVAEQHAAFLRQSGLEVDVYTMCSGQSSRRKLMSGRFGERIFSYREVLRIQSVSLSISYVCAVIALLFMSPRRCLIEIHHPSPLDALLAVLLCTIRRHTLVVTFHAEVVGKAWLLNVLAVPWMYLALRKAHKVLFTSEALLQQVSTRYYSNSDADVVPIAVEERKNVDRTQPKLSSVTQPLQILFIGRLVPYKGVPVLMDAMEGLANAHLRIFGDGPLRAELETRAVPLGAAVTFERDLSDQRKEELLAQADVLVLPSITAAEAFGIVQIEALAQGLPVINTNLPTGARDVIQHGISGLTVPVGDVRALHEALRSLRDDSNLRARLKDGAIRRIAHFEWRHVRERFNVALTKRIDEADFT